MVALVHGSQGRLKRKWHGVKARESEAGAVLQEVAEGQRLVAVFGQEAREVARYREATRRSYRTKLGVMRAQSLIDLLLGLTTAAGGAVILALGTMDVMAKAMTVGDLVLAMTYLAQLYGPLTALGSHIGGQQQAVASAERAFALLDSPPAIHEKAEALPLGRVAGRIEFHGVGFSYPGRGPVLRGVDLAIPAGACVGIVGETGSGKSTLVNMLMRLFDPTEGEIRLGERGTRLSGGEHQRIAIARAFLKDAPILILDEPTSAVDVKTEAGIIAGLERLTAGRTTLMIAHRLETLRGASMILSVAEGRVTAIGRPVEVEAA